jgi:zinc transport system permease protein
MNWLSSFFQNPFLLMAFFTALAASITSGIVGSYVVVKRIVFLCGSIAHSVLGGMGLCLFLQVHYNLPWLNPLYGALFTALLAAFFMGTIHLKYQQREDTLIAVLWTIGMAIGIVFISLTPTANGELLHFLFGNILWVTQADLAVLIILAVAIVVLSLIFHRKFLALCFDEKALLMQGLSAKGYYFLLLLLIALSTVLLIQVVGALLVIALLAIPPAIATTWSNRLSKAIILSIILCSIITTGGLLASYILNWPTGATIALVATAIYLINLPLSKRAYAS